MDVRVQPHASTTIFQAELERRVGWPQRRWRKKEYLRVTGINRRPNHSPESYLRSSYEDNHKYKRVSMPVFS
jgi:hypothetical protein